MLGLLIVGIFVYMAVTPFRERELMRAGNTAAATVLGGALVALAIPLAALLATTGPLLDILVWGVVVVILQLVTVHRLAVDARHARHDRGGSGRRRDPACRRANLDRPVERGRDGASLINGLPIRKIRMLGFLRNFAGVKADNAVQAGVEALVRWDPEGASEAELRTMEQHLDDLGRQVAHGPSGL